MEENKLLVVVDMQNDFVNGVLGTEQARSIVPDVVNAVSKSNMVVFTFDTHSSDYLKTQEGNKLPIEHCLIGTKGHELIDELSVLQGDAFGIIKNTFGSVQLGSFVKEQVEQGIIDTVEIMGVCTDICVISNALLIKAFCPEVKIIVNAKCCAGTTPEAHKNALNAMKNCQIDIVY